KEEGMAPRPGAKVIVVAGSLALASAGYAVGSQSGGGTSGVATAADNGGTGIRAAPGPCGEHLDSLASRLGVSSTKLRSAFDDIRKSSPRPDPRAAFAKALADALGVSESKVTSALDKLGPVGPARAPHPLGPPPGGPGGPGGPPGALRFKVGPPPGFVGDLAKALGVRSSDVRAALAKVRTQLES